MPHTDRARGAEPVDHVADRVAGRLEQVRSDAGGHFVSGRRGGRSLERSDELVLGRLDRDVAPDRQPHGRLHRRLDGRAADLAVALGGVGVAEPEQRPVDLDREVQRRSGAEVLAVHVAAGPPGRDRVEGAGRRARHADDPAERLDRDPDPLVEGRPLATDVPQLEPGLRVVGREQPEARDDGRPAEAVRTELEQVDLEDVTGPRSLDEDRALERVDEPEVEGRQVVARRSGVELAARRVDHVDRDLGARPDRERGRGVAVPADPSLRRGEMDARGAHVRPLPRRCLGR